MREKPHIICIGSVLWDIIGFSDENLDRGNDKEGIISKQPGGVAMNLAMRLRKYNIISAFLSALGDDKEGKDLLQICKRNGILCNDIVICPNARTDYYMAIEDKKGVALAIADTSLLCKTGDSILKPIISGRYKNWKGPIVVDSNLSKSILENLRYNSAFKGSDFRLVPGSPSKVERLKLFLTHPGANFYLNLSEACLILNRRFETSKDAALEIVKTGLRSVLVTNGEKSACFANGSEVVEVKPPKVKIIKLTGAGDVLMASHLAKTLKGFNNREALLFALKETGKFISEGFKSGCS
jgi:sugar/nucleoside kinase (ribokinase family)